MPEQKFCPNCGQSMNFRSAGVSASTGKPYGAFWSCPDRNCGGRMNAGPARPAAAAAPQRAPQAATEPVDSPRLRVAIAALQAAVAKHAGTQATTVAVLGDATAYYNWVKEAFFGDPAYPQDEGGQFP